jgi:hypothetical protein
LSTVDISKYFYYFFKGNCLFRSWTESTLDVAIRWLLRQCGRIETESRRKCIELVCTFIPLLSGKSLFISVKDKNEIYLLKKRNSID